MLIGVVNGAVQNCISKNWLSQPDMQNGTEIKNQKVASHPSPYIRFSQQHRKLLLCVFGK